MDRTGRVDPEDVRRAITPQTTLISTMHANNEAGHIAEADPGRGWLGFHLGRELQRLSRIEVLSVWNAVHTERKSAGETRLSRRTFNWRIDRPKEGPEDSDRRRNDIIRT